MSKTYSDELIEKISEVIHTIIEDQYENVEENSKLSFKDECRLYKCLNSLMTGEPYEETK